MKPADWAAARARLQRRLAVARGEQPPDLVLKGGLVVDVFQGRLWQTEVAICDGLIVGLGDYDGPSLMVDGAIVAPGFIDGHLHLESTMLTPPEFARAVVPRGTTTVILDPHELVNVLGTAGLDYLLAFRERLPLDFFLMLPSCVPASPLETPGAAFGLPELLAYQQRPGVLGLAEVMNFPGVVAGEPELLDKILAFQDQLVDGHAPLLAGPALNAYLVTGIGSDHECLTLEEAAAKLSRGMRIMIREGSWSKQLADLLPLVNPRTLPHLMLVSDDCQPEELATAGHLDRILRRAVALGLEPLSALILVTLNPARYFRLRDRGAVAPGYRADLVILEDLQKFQVRQVLKDGRLVADAGRLTAELAELEISPPPHPLRVNKLTPAAFAIPVQGEVVKIIGVRPHQLLTDKLVETPPQQDGYVVSDVSRDILKLAVLERHHGSGNLGLGLVRGFGLRQGALASTVAHDSHQLIVVGASDAEMYLAARTLIEMGGGLVVVAGPQVLARLPLPLAGLMSFEPLATVVAQHQELMAAYRYLGGSLTDPFMALSFLALPVIPALKLTDRGLVEVERFALVSLFGSA